MSARACHHPNCQKHGKSPCEGIGCDGREIGEPTDAELEGAYQVNDLLNRVGHRVPTNAQLAERAKEKTNFDIVHFWLRQHVRPPYSGIPIDEWMDWAARNFLADPEVRAWLSVMAQRSYQRGYEDGRRAERAPDD